MSVTAAASALRDRSGQVRRPDSGELRAALERLLCVALPSRRIAHVESHPMPYASSFALDEICVRFDHGDNLDLVRKDTVAMLPDARRIKPRFLHSATREMATYQSILAPLGIDAPRCYGTAIDASLSRYWLFLERVPGQPLTEVGDFDVWRKACGWLARMHQRLASVRAVAHVVASVPLVEFDCVQWRLWMQRAQRCVQTGTEPRARRARFAWLERRYEAVVDEIAQSPVGLVHGDFFGSNILVQTAADAVRVRPVDWELAGIGPVLMDLAALTSGRWGDEARTALAMSYHAALDRGGAGWLPREPFLRALEGCRLQMAVRQLGWAAGWTPPATQAQDWLGDAIRAAERLGL